MSPTSQTIAATGGQAAVRRLVALGAGLVALVLFGSAALLAAGSHALDELQAREDHALVASVVDRSLARVVTDITTATVWDQAYRELRPGGSVAWADAEIGSYFANNRGHDRSVVVDGAGVPFYAWAGPARADPRRQADLLAAVAPVIRRARALEAARGARPPRVAPTDPTLAETASGIVMLNGDPYLAAASTVTPESADASRRPGPAVLAASVQRLDRQTVASLRQLRLANPHFERITTPAPNAVLVRGVDGHALGRLVWTPERPGLVVLRGAAWALGLGFTVFALLAGALGWQILRVARQLEAHEQAHDETMRDLEVARDRAESANIAKSQFLANMSHEIRTPLNGVLGMAQVLARSNLASADQEKLGVIRASGESLLRILNDLLDLSKVEAGRMEVDVHDFDMEREVESATSSFATLAEQKDVAFLVEVDPAACGTWRGDGGKIRQVLANLASNAVKFTNAGEIRVAVRRTPDGIVCTVADSGAGIARDRLEQLFQRFSQVDPTATRKFGGTGLGLAISRELVELLGGQVSVTSVEGRGSAFTFELPLTWVGPSVAADVADETPTALPALRILAAEDNKTNQLLLHALLEPLDVTVRMTSDGAEALAAFRDQDFDLVLMDIQMPVMNGVDAVRAIRALEAERGGSRTPILALSANVMSYQIEEYLAAGMNGFIAKPIEMAALISAMERALAPDDAEAKSAAA
jgi:signal transduction histidine kinase/ActR/RegA family two-component response regulator